MGQLRSLFASQSQQIDPHLVIVIIRVMEIIVGSPHIPISTVAWLGVHLSRSICDEGLDVVCKVSWCQ